jgi:hypothetical protein
LNEKSIAFNAFLEALDGIKLEWTDLGRIRSTGALDSFFDCEWERRGSRVEFTSHGLDSGMLEKFAATWKTWNPDWTAARRASALSLKPVVRTFDGVRQTAYTPRPHGGYGGVVQKDVFQPWLVPGVIRRICFAFEHPATAYWNGKWRTRIVRSASGGSFAIVADANSFVQVWMYAKRDDALPSTYWALRGDAEKIVPREILSEDFVEWKAGGELVTGARVLESQAVEGRPGLIVPSRVLERIAFVGQERECWLVRAQAVGAAPGESPIPSVLRGESLGVVDEVTHEVRTYSPKDGWRSVNGGVRLHLAPTAESTPGGGTGPVGESDGGVLGAILSGAGVGLVLLGILLAVRSVRERRTQDRASRRI